MPRKKIVAYDVHNKIEAFPTLFQLKLWFRLYDFSDNHVASFSDEVVASSYHRALLEDLKDEIERMTPSEFKKFVTYRGIIGQELAREIPRLKAYAIELKIRSVK